MADTASTPNDSLHEIARAIAEQKCILFIGSAVHCGPPDQVRCNYPPASRPMLANDLSKHLARRSGFIDRYPEADVLNLQRVALDFEVQKHRSLLITEIRQQVDTNKSPSPLLQALAEMSFPLIVTTNYDQLCERALEAAGKRPFVSVYKSNEESIEATDDYPSPEEPSAERPFLLKLHGDVVTRPDSIVITDEDYIQFILRMSDKGIHYPIPETFLYFFKKWPTLFIGYSLKDYNLRVLFKTLRWKIAKGKVPPTYSVDLNPDPLIFDVWHLQRRYVTYIVQDMWSFVPELYEAVLGRAMLK